MKPFFKSLFLAAMFLAPLLLRAYSGGGPYAHTGYGGEPTCESFGCHTPNPLPGTGGGRVVIDVGPYVPGQRQQIVVTVIDSAAQRWGFQLAARLMSNLQTQAGSLAIPSVPADYNFTQVRCADGTLPPCASGLQYAGHTSVGTRAKNPSGYVTFLVDWIAPSSDVGPVVFSAAGLGADGDQGTNGDHTYTTTAVSLYAPSNTPTLNQGGIVNGASFAQNGPIAAGTIVTLFGSNLAPPGFQREVMPSDLDKITGKLPIELSRAGADFFVPNLPNAIPAYMLFVGEKQLNVQVPALPTNYTGPVQVQPVFNRGQGANEVRGNMVSVQVRSISPALFTFANSNSAAAITVGGQPIGRPGQFPSSRPARPSDVVEVYGTGFGVTNPPVEPGMLAPGGGFSPTTGTLTPLVAAVSAQIGGLILAPSDILDAGAAPAFAGLYQFNLRVPSAAPNGDLPIVVSVGGVSTQPGVVLTVQQ
jgi:uncharacterized protein (TIGR03437 family)